MAQCFISHATADRSFVKRELLGLMEAIGVNPWYAEEDIDGGAEFGPAIQSGLSASDWFQVVASQASADSRYVRAELNWAVANRQGRIIPVVIGDCDLSALHIQLPLIQYIDFRGDPTAARNRLITLLINGVYRPTRMALAVRGRWRGSQHQHVGPDGGPLDYGVELHLEAKSQDLIGTLLFILDESFLKKYGMKEVLFDITGGFSHDRFIQFSYVSRDPAVVQFGAALLELKSTGKSMVGMSVAYGAISDRIISGDIQLEYVGTRS
jgi:hypothetical protein